MSYELKAELRLNGRIITTLKDQNEPYCIIRCTVLEVSKVQLYFSLFKNAIDFKEGQTHNFHLSQHWASIFIGHVHYNRVELTFSSVDEMVQFKRLPSKGSVH